MKIFQFLILLVCFSSMASINAQNAEQKVHVLNFKSNKCTFENLARVNQRVISFRDFNDTLKLKIGVIDNCSMTDSITMTIKNTTLKIQRHYSINQFGYKVMAECDCYSELEFEFIGQIDTSFFVLYNGRLLQKHVPKYIPAQYKVDENGDSIIVVDDHGFQYAREYYDNGQIKQLFIQRGSYREYIQYYENGQLKKIGQFFGSFDYGIVKEWDKAGKLIYYENHAIDENFFR